MPLYWPDLLRNESFDWVSLPVSFPEKLFTVRNQIMSKETTQASLRSFSQTGELPAWLAKLMNKRVSAPVQQGQGKPLNPQHFAACGLSAVVNLLFKDVSVRMNFSSRF